MNPGLRPTPGPDRQPILHPEGDSLIAQDYRGVRMLGAASWYAPNETCHPFPYPLDVVQPGVGALEQRPFRDPSEETDFTQMQPQLTPGMRTLHQILRLR
jgi:hypothetical protein